MAGQGSALAINDPLATINHSYFKELPAFYTSGGNNFVSRKQKSAIFAFFLATDGTNETQILNNNKDAKAQSTSTRA
jgi:hypothetical protein